VARAVWVAMASVTPADPPRPTVVWTPVRPALPTGSVTVRGGSGPWYLSPLGYLPLR